MLDPFFQYTQTWTKTQTHKNTHNAASHKIVLTPHYNKAKCYEEPPSWQWCWQCALFQDFQLKACLGCFLLKALKAVSLFPGVLFVFFAFEFFEQINNNILNNVEQLLSVQQIDEFFLHIEFKSLWWRWDISSLKAASLFLALLPHVLFVLLARSPAQVLLGTGCTNTQAHLAITHYK